MAKTKEQRAAAHRCQLERKARKRQRRNLLESTQQRTVAHMSSVEPSGRSQALPRKQTMQLLESNEGEIFFPSAKSEEGGETVRQEMHVRSTGEEQSTQGVKEPAASLAQGAEGKLEEPNAALVEIISDGVATTYELPISSDSIEFLESNEGSLFFPSAKFEEGGETDGQEIHDISTGEKESTRGKKEQVASLAAQAAEGKLEEPNAALVETISEGEATADEFPTSSDSSGGEADEEVCRAVEKLSDLSVIEVFEEKGTAHVCVVCAGSGLLLDETCPLCDELELERRNAAVQYYTSESDVATDELQVMSSRCNGDIDDMERTGAAELPSSLSAELDRVIWNLSAHMNSLTESVRTDEVPLELEIVDLDSQDPAHQISILAKPHVEESHNSALASALHAYGTAYEAVVRFKFGGPQPSVPAAALHEAGKVKLQIYDLNGAVRNFAEAEAIHRQMGTLKTLAGAHLLLDIGVANLVSGEIDDALEACGGICEFAGVLRTPASMKFLHEVVSLPCQCGSLDGAHKILAAAYTFMENVHKAEFETFVSRWSQILRSPIGRFFGECS